MEFQGIELYNVRELEYNSESGGYKLSRLPKSLREKMTDSVYAAAGVELRFVPIDDEIKIKIRKCSGGVSRVMVFYGSVQSGWKNLYKNIYDTPTEIVIPKSPNIEKLRLISESNSFPFSPDVVRVVLQNASYEIFEVSGRCTPPTPNMLPDRTYLAYGSSITHGSLAALQANTYVARLGEYFGADVINFGFAGSARLEPEVADYIAEQCEFDFATLEMGINILKIDDSDFRERVRYFVKRIAEPHPNKKIFCIDVFYMSTDITRLDDETSNPNRFRRIVKEVITELNLPNTVYVSGLDMLCGSRWLSEDLTHPNARGVEELSRNLSAFIEKHL